jgi:hypothetical protein
MKNKMLEAALGDEVYPIRFPKGTRRLHAGEIKPAEYLTVHNGMWVEGENPNTPVTPNAIIAVPKEQRDILSIIPRTPVEAALHYVRMKSLGIGELVPPAAINIWTRPANDPRSIQGDILLGAMDMTERPIRAAMILAAELNRIGGGM